MGEETAATRGDAAWKEQREAISKRNGEAQRRSQSARTERASAAASTAREEAQREADQLRQLNKRLAKQQARAAR